MYNLKKIKTFQGIHYSSYILCYFLFFEPDSPFTQEIRLINVFLSETSSRALVGRFLFEFLPIH